MVDINTLQRFSSALGVIEGVALMLHAKHGFTERLQEAMSILMDVVNDYEQKIRWHEDTIANLEQTVKYYQEKEQKNEKRN